MDWRKIREDDPQRLLKLCEAGLAIDGDRKAHQKVADVLEAEVKEVKEQVRLAMLKAGMKEIKTKTSVVKLVPKDVYQMDPDAGGWGKIWSYITKNKAFDLLEKRLHQTACKLRYEDKKKIPGVKVFSMVVVKLGDAE